MDVSSFVGKLLEEGLAQHEPEPAGRGTEAHAWSGSRQGTVHLDSGRARFPVSTCRFVGRRSSYSDRSVKDDEAAMRYVMLIYQGVAPQREAALRVDEQEQVCDDH